MVEGGDGGGENERRAVAVSRFDVELVVALGKRGRKGKESSYVGASAEGEAPHHGQSFDGDPRFQNLAALEKDPHRNLGKVASLRKRERNRSRRAVPRHDHRGQNARRAIRPTAGHHLLHRSPVRIERSRDGFDHVGLGGADGARQVAVYDLNAVQAREGTRGVGEGHVVSCFVGA